MTIANSKHIEVSLDKIRALFVKASEAIEALAPGGKIPATALAERIGEEFDIAGPQLYPTLKFLFNSYPGVKILRGAHGGIYKLTAAELAKNTPPVVVAPVIAAPIAAPVANLFSDVSITADITADIVSPEQVIVPTASDDKSIAIIAQA